jgi:hypothetical protein
VTAIHRSAAQEFTQKHGASIVQGAASNLLFAEMLRKKRIAQAGGACGMTIAKLFRKLSSRRGLSALTARLKPSDTVCGMSRFTV